MPEDKTLPKDDSDDSMPGRYEESNIDFIENNPEFFLKPKSKNKAFVVIALVFGAVFAGSMSYYFMYQDEVDSRIIQSVTVSLDERLAYEFGVGEYGSDHAHAALAVFVDGNQLNFAQPQYQLTSKYIHFENHNSYLVHKHATGTPLGLLFASFGMKVTAECIVLNDSTEFAQSYCAGDSDLVIFVNGVQYYSDISQYEISHDDRILISLGDPKLVAEQLEYLESLRIYDIPGANSGDEFFI